MRVVRDEERLRGMTLQIGSKTNFVVAIVFTIVGMGMVLIGIGLLLGNGNTIFILMTITGGVIMAGRSIVSILQELDVIL